MKQIQCYCREKAKRNEALSNKKFTSQKAGCKVGIWDCSFRNFYPNAKLLNSEGIQHRKDRDNFAGVFRI